MEMRMNEKEREQMRRLQEIEDMGLLYMGKNSKIDAVTKAEESTILTRIKQKI